MKLVTDEQQFDALDKSKLGIIPVTTEVWENFVFVNFDPNPRESLREWLEPLYSQNEGYFERRTMIVNRAYTYKPKNLGGRLAGPISARGRDVVREDLNTLEAQQAMLSFGAIPEIVLSRQETCLKHHYRVMETMLRQN